MEGTLGGSCVIAMVIDGLSVDYAERYFDLPLDMSVKDSWFPTLTGCVHLSLMTGKTPGENNIPSMRWMDKQNGCKRTYFNLTGSMDKDFEGKTIFNTDSSVSIFSPVSPGFRKVIPPIGHMVSHGFNTWELFDKLAFKILNRYNSYQFKFLCLYSVDEISHRFGMNSKRVKAACKMLNEKIQSIIKTSDEEIVILSDHGLTETKNHIDLIKTFKKRGFKTRGFPFYIGSQDVFVAVCGNSMAHIYLNDKIKITKIIKVLEQIKGIDKIYTRNIPENDRIFDSSRCGDIVVTSEPGYDLRTWEIPEHKASHGSSCPEHYKVPIYSNMKIRGKKIEIPWI